MADYGKLPSGVKLTVNSFKAHIDDQKIQDFKTLLKLSPVSDPTYENSHDPIRGRYGTSRDWLLKAKEYWLDKFDWRKVEDSINAYPNFIAQVLDNHGHNLDIHFVALFSAKPDAIPLALYHGWPGSFLEFLPTLNLLKQKYSSAQDLPYHVIVPSIPGYAYSSGPPLDGDYSVEDAADALDNLMVGLGFSSYIAQGGDLGSFIARHQGATSAACKGVHVNFCPMPPPANAHELPLEEVEKEALPRGLWFRDVGSAYSLMHGTRTATIGHALSASPLALLSWIGEKFLDWSDEDPSLDDILSDVTLYWMTKTIPRCLYPYRGMAGDEERPRIAKASAKPRARPYVEKPSGYSFFPKELVPMPKSWVAQCCNLVSAKTHTSGGHFAALEKPKELLADIEEYIEIAWKG